MKILVINAGSSSLKYQFIDMTDENVIAKGIVEQIGDPLGRIKHSGKAEYKEEKYIPDHLVAFDLVVKALTDSRHGVIESMDEISAVGHRVLHSGPDFHDSTLIDEDSLNKCKKNAVFGPLHMPANISCIEAAQKILPDTPMCAVFDTAFHMTMPDYASRYAIPKTYYTDHFIKKYGFHGTSHKYITTEVTKYLGKENAGRLIICHLGNGSSLSAVKDGKVIDTSMGLTPLEGLIMGTRSGDLDPAVVEYIAQIEDVDVHEVLRILNKESGLKGLCGVSDFREVEALYNKDDADAKLAVEMFQYRVKKYIAQYYVALGGCDAIIMTGGIGENSNFGRKFVLENLECIGIELDEAKNDSLKRGEVSEIQKESSKVKIIVMPTNEELLIARDTKQLVENR